VGTGFFTSLAPKLKSIGKRFGGHALKAGLDFINEIVVEKKSPKQAVKSIAINRLNKAFSQNKGNRTKPIKKGHKRKNSIIPNSAAQRGSIAAKKKKKNPKKNPFAI